MKIDTIFFAENGLTATSANYIANIAKEYISQLEKEVMSVEFYSTYIGLIGTSDSCQIHGGVTNEEMIQIPEKLKHIADAKSLIAWLREAIKAKQSLMSEIENMELPQYIKIVGAIVPERPVKASFPSSSDIIAEMSVKQRNLVYSLQTEAATIGKYIHPDGQFAKARQRFLDRLRNPYDANEDGRDTVIKKYEPTVSTESLEETFFSMQKRHREVQAQLNGIMHEIDEKVRAKQLEIEMEYRDSLAVYNHVVEQLTVDLNVYKQTEAKRISALKIIIPNDLKGIYEIVNSVVK